MTTYLGMFKSRYLLVGRDWVRKLSPEDRSVFIQIGLAAAEYGHKGGLARSSSANRDAKGRFTK